MECKQYVTPNLDDIATRLASHCNDAETADLLDALYYLDAIAANDYNRDCFRALMNALDQIYS